MKKQFLILMMLLSSVGLFAQEQTDSAIKRTDSLAWYIGANVGAQVFNGFNDSEMSYGKRISAVGGISGGRWMNNWLALDASLSFAQFRGVYTTPRGDKHFVTDKLYGSGKLRWQKGCYMNLNLNVRFDLNTVIYGYKQERHHHFLPYLSVGGATGLGSGNFKLAPAFGVGLQYQYAFTPQMAFLADFGSHWFGNGLDNEHCTLHKVHPAYGLRLGFVYTFKKCNKKQTK